MKLLMTCGHARDQVLLALVKSKWQVSSATTLLEGGGSLKAYYFKSGAASKAVCGASEAAPRGGGASDVAAQDIGSGQQCGTGSWTHYDVARASS